MVQLTTIPTISDLLSRVIDPANGSFSEELARFLTDCRFPDNEQRRLKELAERQRQQGLTADESQCEESQCKSQCKTQTFSARRGWFG